MYFMYERVIVAALTRSAEHSNYRLLPKGPNVKRG